MGISTDAYLSYGYMVEEGHAFPWDTEDEEGDVDVWWRKVNSYVSPFDQETYTEDGQYSEWVRKLSEKERNDTINKLWESQHDWDHKNPIPFTLVNYYSCDYPMYIISIPSTVITASRGCPEKIISLPKIKGIKAFRECLIKYGIHSCEEDPSWYLSSLMC